VTSSHAIQGAGGSAKLVLNAGTPEQRILTSKLLWRNRASDLALLRAENAEALAALPLGPAAGLIELMDVVVLGFSFGQVPAVAAGAGADQYPAISMNRGAISSLQRRNGQLERIHLNAAVNPGNSGGPLLDSKGRVAGVVLGRVEGPIGAGIDLAIPGNVLDRFLARPTIDLSVPNADSVNAQESIEFEAHVASLVPWSAC
jgi:S1-C subfamily serine protease